jgi:octaprenyl-diphosphate synthase
MKSRVERVVTFNAPKVMEIPSRVNTRRNIDSALTIESGNYKEIPVSQTASRTMQTKDASGVGNPSKVSQAISFDLQDVYAPVADELQSVESLLRDALQSDTPFVDQLLEHSWLLGGKRIRPVLLLLSAASCGNVSQPHLQMAAALEMIHTATLVHDDVLDEAETRRHRATANSTWGNKISVLLGDYLFTHSFHVASLAGSSEALRLLAQASNRVCEGEMRQNGWQGDFDLTEESYLQMITEKTAELCGVGCKLGAFLSGADAEIVEQFETYGRNLGVAFQIIDDVLDIVGQPEQVGDIIVSAADLQLDVFVFGGAHFGENHQNGDGHGVHVLDVA